MEENNSTNIKIESINKIDFKFLNTAYLLSIELSFFEFTFILLKKTRPIRAERKIVKNELNLNQKSIVPIMAIKKDRRFLIFIFPMTKVA